MIMKTTIAAASMLAGLTAAAPLQPSELETTAPGHRISARYINNGAIINLVGGDANNGPLYVSCDANTQHCIGTTQSAHASKFIVSRGPADAYDMLRLADNANLCLNIWGGGTSGQVNLWDCNSKGDSSSWVDTTNGQPQPTQLRAQNGACMYWTGENMNMVARPPADCDGIARGDWRTYWSMHVLLNLAQADYGVSADPTITNDAPFVTPAVAPMATAPAQDTVGSTDQAPQLL